MFGNHRKTDNIQDRAEQIAAEAADSIRDLGRGAYDRAEDVKTEAARLLNSAADTIRHEARQAKASKEARRNVDNVAKGLERTAHYLKKHSLEDMSEDVTGTVKENPWRMLAIIFAVGLVIGLLLRGGEEDEHHRYNGYNGYNSSNR